MGNLGVVRLESLRIENIKNVKNGKIFFPEYKKLSRNEYDVEELGSILGLYGQNGSGKTTVIDGLRILQTLLCGSPLISFNPSFITNGENACAIEADFLIKSAKTSFYVNYYVQIESQNRMEFHISKEKLSYNGKDIDRKMNYFSFEQPNTINTAFLGCLNDTEKAIYTFTTNIETRPNINTNFCLSSIFNSKTLDIISKAKGVDANFKYICQSLRNFASYKFAIYSLSYFNDNQNVGIRFRVKNSQIEMQNISDYFVPFTPTLLRLDQFNAFKDVVDQINKVMPYIIPNYKLDYIILNKKLEQEYSKTIQFVLVSKRGEGQPIPLSLESNGIKKILSILSGFIDAFNNEGCLIAIDELDSGIFEYLLGEIVYAFANFGKGQLIFNSHNLRVLEKTDYKNFFFTSTDRKDAFVQINKIRDSNNLRDIYYKYLTNFEENDKKLYDAVRTEEMINALYMGD